MSFINPPCAARFLESLAANLNLERVTTPGKYVLLCDRWKYGGYELGNLISINHWIEITFLGHWGNRMCALAPVKYRIVCVKITMQKSNVTNRESQVDLIGYTVISGKINFSSYKASVDAFGIKYQNEKLRYYRRPLLIDRAWPVTSNTMAVNPSLF